MPTKPTTTKTAAAKTPRKPRAPRAKKETAEKAHEAASHEHTEAVVATPKVAEISMPSGKYVFATGRRKTAVANVRLFEGKGDSTVNKLPLAVYFGYTYFQEEIKKPFETTGLLNDYHFTAHVNGGGHHSQAQALMHGVSVALGKISEEVRRVLKKNGLLTRDDRKKERKKPGLKRARRSPQWAKR
jgi:small subunit ribosomal protein S9